MLFLWLGFLIPFYLSMQMSPLQWSVKQWWLSHREHKDNTLLPSGTKNLDLGQVNITSQTEDSITCGGGCLVTQSCLALCIAVACSMPDLSVPHHLLEFPKFIFIASVMPFSHLILWCPLLLLPSIFPSIGVFSNDRRKKQLKCEKWSIYMDFFKMKVESVTHSVVSNSLWPHGL